MSRSCLCMHVYVSMSIFFFRTMKSCASEVTANKFNEYNVDFMSYFPIKPVSAFREKLLELQAVQMLPFILVQKHLIKKDA